MSKIDIIIPEMGESITEATIIKWAKKVNEFVKTDETVVEIATDKVDTDIPSPADGVITEIFFDKGATVEVGKVIAIIDTQSPEAGAESKVSTDEKTEKENTQLLAQKDEVLEKPEKEDAPIEVDSSTEKRFYSPLVRNMAKQDNISPAELEKIEGSGKNGRITKNDIIAFLAERKSEPKESKPGTSIAGKPTGKDVVVEMDRMRQLIAEHMTHSLKTSAHVTSFAEADMSKVVKWREKMKDSFQQKHNEKLTFTHLLIYVLARVLKNFPTINASVKDNTVIVKKNINIGMATALDNGNLIVPVIKNADLKSLDSLALSANDLALRARNNSLKPDEIQGGTFTITNLGTFNTLTGTPIINQPQLAIMSFGVIKKRPVVIETAEGDVIAVKPMMYISLTYDHRVIDGALGGMFLNEVVQQLEKFEIK